MSEDASVDGVRLDGDVKSAPVGPVPFAANGAPGGIFLADAESTLAIEREGILRELAARGHTVFAAARDEASVHRALKLSTLSVHLLGDGAPDAAHVAIDFRAALEEARRRADFTQLVWMTPDRPDAPMATSLIEEAFGRPARDGAIEVLRNGFEDFKTYIGDRLRLPAEPAGAVEASSRPRLYVMCDRRDAAIGRSVGICADECGIDVITSSYETDHSTLREHHQRSLRVCDAALIVYGGVTEQWVRMKQQDLKKAAGFGRERPMVASAVLIGPDPTLAKARFQAANMEILDVARGLSPELLSPFLQRILSS
jgi:hypothetical protein